MGTMADNDSRTDEVTSGPMLGLDDAQAVADLEQLALRTKTIGTTGMRFQVFANVLATWVSVLAPAGLGNEVPMVMGMRTQKLHNTHRGADNGEVTAPDAPDASGTPEASEAPEHQPAALDGLDMVFDLDAVTDRTARMKSQGSTVFMLPPRQLQVAWTAQTPPRSGWEPLAVVDDADLVTVADAGIAELADSLPQNPGESMVSKARAGVWSRLIGDPDTSQFPAGAALGAHTLGFLAEGGTTTVHGSGKWTRLSSQGGYVLARSAAVL